ncbi:MAG: hypothetical protein HY692_05830 [Cyanobacteria bacterium NC_groundwater_1444_Ag_S-0.65um_54_12]|nr:hypothetical protein [Cyanobacteria bacterium NC_groundwater_1444_Ag_S-0.65um_54_12]
MPTTMLARTIQHFAGSWLDLHKLDWSKPDIWHMEASLAGKPLSASGKVELTADGRLAFLIQRLQLQQGNSKLALRLDLSKKIVHATVPETFLQDSLRSILPLSQLAVKVHEGQRLMVTGRYQLWGLKLPLAVRGRLTLGEAGAVRYTIEEAQIGKYRMPDFMERLGINLSQIVRGDAKAWEGNTYVVRNLRLPANLALNSLTTRQGSIEATLQIANGLPQKLRGISLLDNRLEIDPQAFFAFPGTIQKVQAAGDGLSLHIALDRQKVRSLVKTPEGITFDGTALYATPAAIARQPLPIRLLSISGGTKGLAVRFAIDPTLLDPLKRLPSGIQFTGTGFDIDPKQGRPLPGRLLSATGSAAGLKLRFALSDAELKAVWKSQHQGVAWNGQALLLDPAALPGKARATGVAVKAGDLEIELGDGTSFSPVAGADHEIHFAGTGPMQLRGIQIANIAAVIRPKQTDMPIRLDQLKAANIEIQGGRVTVPPATIDQILHQKLGKDYEKLSPSFAGRRLVVQVPILFGRIPLALRFKKTADGNLQLVPTGFFGQFQLFEWPQRLIGSLLNPLSFLIPTPTSVKVNLQAAAASAGVKLPPLAEVSADASGLLLDFGRVPDDLDQ